MSDPARSLEFQRVYPVIPRDLCVKDVDSKVFAFEGADLDSLPPSLDLSRLPPAISHHQRLPSIRIMQRSLRGRTPRIQRPHPHREIGLQFVHPRLHLMLRDRLPHIRRPMLDVYKRQAQGTMGSRPF